MSENRDTQVEDPSAVGPAKAEGKAAYTTALPAQNAWHVGVCRAIE